MDRFPTGRTQREHLSIPALKGEKLLDKFCEQLKLLGDDPEYDAKNLAFSVIHEFGGVNNGMAIGEAGNKLLDSFLERVALRAEELEKDPGIDREDGEKAALAEFGISREPIATTYAGLVRGTKARLARAKIEHMRNIEARGEEEARLKALRMMQPAALGKNQRTWRREKPEDAA
jgi:hypothetical protein